MRGDFPLDRAAPPRWLTVPMSKLYSWSATRYHNSWDKREQYHASVPVISVGNLAVGGTGKSPTVIALARLLREKYSSLKAENAIAVLSRGYGRVARGVVVVKEDTDWRESGDEPLIIKGARHATDKLGSKLIILDDGFQHRPIYRDLDLVMVDGEHPFGNGRLLPAGPLRERMGALARADCLISVGYEVGAALELSERFGKPHFQALSKSVLPSELIQNPKQPVFVVSGIARPERLYKSLDDNNISICGRLAFSDHHPFGPEDREAIYRTAEQAGAEAVLTTPKDRVRMDSWSYELPLLTIGLELEFIDPIGLLALIAPKLSNI
jgi:tetraacyldisaccharide 4'-kinase